MSETEVVQVHAEGQLARSLDWESLDGHLRHRLVHAATSRFGLTLEESEDVLQTVLVRVLRHNPRVHDPVAYVTRAFWYGCLNRLRAMGRTPLFDELSDTSAAFAPETGDAAAMVQHAFSRTDRLCRTLVKHYFLEEGTLATAAAAAGYTGKSIWRKVQRCLKAMRECLG